VMVGRKRDLVRDAWAERYGKDIRYIRGRYMFSEAGMAQLCRCRSDEARRLLLGIGEQVEETGYTPMAEELAGEKPCKRKVGGDAQSFLERNLDLRRDAA
jgi:hypothetical protein